MLKVLNKKKKDLGINSVSLATCIESNESVHQPNLSATVSTSACETNPESESSSSSGSQSEDEMPVPDARLFSSGKYERRFTWLYYNVAKGGYCCKLCEIFCPFLPSMQVNQFVSLLVDRHRPSCSKLLTTKSLIT